MKLNFLSKSLKLRRELGVSMIEASFALPVVLTFLFGGICFSLYYSAKASARNQAFNQLNIVQIRPGLEDEANSNTGEWARKLQADCQQKLNSSPLSPFVVEPHCEVTVPQNPTPQAAQAYNEILEKIPVKVTVTGKFGLQIPLMPLMKISINESAIGFREIHQSPNAPPLLDCFGRLVTNPSLTLQTANCPCAGDPMKVSSCSDDQISEAQKTEEGGGSVCTDSSCHCRPGTVTQSNGSCKCPQSDQIFNLDTLACECAPCGPNETRVPGTCQCKCGDGTVGSSTDHSCHCGTPGTEYQEFYTWGNVLWKGCYCPNYLGVCTPWNMYLRPDHTAGCGCRCNPALPGSTSPYQLELINGVYRSTIDGAYCKAKGLIYGGQQEWWCLSECKACPAGSVPNATGTACDQPTCDNSCPGGQRRVRLPYTNACGCAGACEGAQVVSTAPDGSTTCGCNNSCAGGAAPQGTSCSCTCPGTCHLKNNSNFTPEGGCNCACGDGRYDDGNDNCVRPES